MPNVFSQFGCYLASLEERPFLLFPEDWDMNEAEKLTGLRKEGRPA
jgi:hypothetical protein